MRAPSARPGDLRIGTASGVAALATDVAGANEEFRAKRGRPCRMARA